MTYHDRRSLSFACYGCT